MTYNTFKQKLLSFIDLGIESNSKHNYTLPIGYTSVKDLQEALCCFIDWWTTSIDEMLVDLPPDTEEFYSLLEKRFISFSEYKKLFSTYDIGEYGQAYTMIVDQQDCNSFLNGRQANFEGYVDLLEGANAIPFVNYLDNEIAINLPMEDIYRHIYVSGRSGSGKSVLLQNMMYELIQESNTTYDKAVVLVDPHGDIAERVRAFKMNTNAGRLVYFDPYLVEGKTPTLNPFEITNTSEQYIDIHTQELVKVFKEIIADSTLSTQMDALLKPCIGVLLRTPGTTLQDLQVFMDDGHNAQWVEKGKQSPNPNHRYFFETGFGKSSYKVTKNSIYTKIQSLLNSYTFYNLVVGKSTIDLSSIDQGKVIVFNLAQGKMGTEVSAVFGKFVISYLQSLIMQRVNQEEGQRKPCFLFADEFQLVVSASIKKVLTETRKFGLHLIAANQVVGMGMDTEMKHTMLSNTAVKIVGENAPQSLKVLSPEMGLSLDVLTQIPPFHFWVKTRGRQAILIQSSTQYLNRMSEYYLSPKQERGLINYIANQSELYKPIKILEITEANIQCHSKEIRNGTQHQDNFHKPFSDQF